jgi:16S rRNA (uracil1498-N3)-methyltransferase
MRLHRFYINEKVGERKEITLTDPELIHQLGNVFRFKVSDHVIVFDGFGFEYEAEIILINKKQVRLNILKSSQGVSSALGGDSLASKNISLYLSLIKKSNFELATEKCTEIGVTEIHPIISERSEKKDLNLERLNKIVKEASEQSGRTTLPAVFDILSLEEAVSQAIKEGKMCVVFHTNTDSGTAPLNNLIRHKNDTFPSTDGKVSLKPTAAFVGPEGGWSDTEMELFRKNNFKILSLGQNILRAETAAMVAVWSQIKNQ